MKEESEKLSNVQEASKTDEEARQEEVVHPDFEPRVLIFACRH